MGPDRIEGDQPPFTPLRSPQRRPQAPHLKSKFLAVTSKKDRSHHWRRKTQGRSQRSRGGSTPRLKHERLQATQLELCQDAQTPHRKRKNSSGPHEGLRRLHFSNGEDSSSKVTSSSSTNSSTKSSRCSATARSKLPIKSPALSAEVMSAMMRYCTIANK